MAPPSEAATAEARSTAAARRAEDEDSDERPKPAIKGPQRLPADLGGDSGSGSRPTMLAAVAFDLEGKLSAAQIIDPAEVDAGGKVVFGATVDLEEESSGDKVRYQIVGEDEADLKLGLINISSPIARALIGKEEGDTAEVQAPGGVKRYEIVGVQYI